MTPATLMWMTHGSSPTAAHPVDGPGRLVHVVPGPDPLTGAEDLPGARQVEGMDITGVTMQRNGAARLEPHQLRPAARCKTQRAECLPRSGPNPGQAAGVARPGT